MSDIGERRTAFPNIWVDSISVNKPPFDEKGVVQEFVGRGATREFEQLEPGSAMSETRIQDIFHSIEDSIGPLRDSFRVEYNLLVRSVDDNVATERMASARARAWARLVNPFTPDVLEVSRPTVNRTLTDMGPGTIYDITVSVKK